LAWNDEFDEPGSNGEASARVENEILPEEHEEEEEEEAVDWGEAEEVLAPFGYGNHKLSQRLVENPQVKMWYRDRWQRMEAGNHICLAGYA